MHNMNGANQTEDVNDRLDRIEDLLRQLVQQRTIKEWYTTAEIAQLVGKAKFTVREWCRSGRIHAQKRACGRGPTQEWMISHEELLRYQNHGLLPDPNLARHCFTSRRSRS
jgi:hypothetical protein